MSSSSSVLKDEGNALLNSDPAAAIAKWALAIACEDCSEEIKIACYSNSALAHVLLRSWKDAIRCASAAVALSPTPHVKALFRRAQAYRALGSPGRAAADLTSILKADKANSSARAELDAVAAERLRPHVHADFMVRLLRCDRTDERGEEAGGEAALCACLELSLKGRAHDAFEAFQRLPPDSAGGGGPLDVPRSACHAWLLLGTMQFEAAEDIATSLVEGSAAAADDKAAASSVARADLLMLLAFVLAGAAHYDAALDRCDEAVQLLRQHYGRDSSVEVARALANVGSVMVKAGHVQDAFAVFKKAITTFAKDGGESAFEMVVLFRLIGDACVKEKEFSNALGSYQEGFDALKKAGELQSSIPLEVARLHLGTSACALGMGKLDDAFAACEHASALVAAAQGGKLSGEIAFDVLWQKAKIASERHQAAPQPCPADDAVAAHDHALAALKAVCSLNEHAAADRAAYVFQSRALCLYRAAQHERALVDHQEALRLHVIACKGVNSPLTLVFGSNVAQSLLAVGRCGDALAHWTSTESGLSALFPSEKDRCAPLMSCTINRAVVLLAMGQKEEAKSAILSAKALGSAFGVASAVFAAQCVMTSASCSAYLSACALLFLLPHLDPNAGSAVSNSVVRSFAASLTNLVKNPSDDPNAIYALSKADVPAAWCGEFVDHLGDVSRTAFETAMQHLQKQLL